MPKLNLFQDSPFTELTDGIGFFEMRGGTIGWFVTPEATVVIDSQFEDTAGTFLNGIGEFGGGTQKILINTHHHGDHTSGNPVFDEAGYQIIAHERVPELQRQSAEDPENAEQQSFAETTFEDQLEIPIGRESMLLKYYGPAHTSGDSVIWLQDSNIVHMGDLIFNRIYPFIDREAGASISNWISILETVSDEADSETRFIFGHGNPEFGVTGTADDLLHMRDFLTELLEFTQSEIEAGKSLEEITRKESFDSFPDYVSPGDFLSLPRNLNVAYQELTED